MILLIKAYVVTNNKNESDQPVSTGSIMGLSIDDENALLKHAENGDGESAFRLYQCYAFSKLDKKKSMKWLEISANNGVPSAQFNLAVELLFHEDFEGAKYWAKKAELNEKGNKAKGLMEEILEAEITSNK